MPANDSRSLDRILRTLRATMRTYNLPRPDRLVISTKSRSVHAEFTTGTAPDRVAALLVWTATLHGVSLGLTHQRAGLLHLAATGRTGAGIGVGLACSATAAELGGTVREIRDSGGVLVCLAEVAMLPPLPEFDTDAVSYDELAQLVTTARAMAARPVGVAA